MPKRETQMSDIEHIRHLERDARHLQNGFHDLCDRFANSIKELDKRLASAYPVGMAEKHERYKDFIKNVIKAVNQIDASDCPYCGKKVNEIFHREETCPLDNLKKSVTLISTRDLLELVGEIEKETGIKFGDHLNHA